MVKTVQSAAIGPISTTIYEVEIKFSDGQKVVGVGPLSFPCWADTENLSQIVGSSLPEAAMEWLEKYQIDKGAAEKAGRDG